MDRGGQGGLPEDIPEVEQFAEGGEPPVGEPVLVGEEGPELVQFGSKVNIFNTRETIEAAETINNMMRNNFEIINNIDDNLDREFLEKAERILNSKILPIPSPISPH